MSDGKGFQVVLKLNLKPDAQYQSGDSLIIQGDTVAEVQAHLTNLVGGDGQQGKLILDRFGDYALGNAVAAALNGPSEADGVQGAPVATAPPLTVVPAATPNQTATTTTRMKNPNAPMSDAQKNLISKMGGAVDPSWTMSQASAYIDQLKALKAAK